MAIVAMKRLHMLALEADRDMIFDELQRLGCVEVSEQNDKLADPGWAELVHPDESDLSEQQERLDLISGALETLAQHAPVKKKLLAARPQIQTEELFDDAALSGAIKTAEALRAYSRELDAAYSQIQKLGTQIKALTPWLSLDVPLNTQPTGMLYTAFGMIPAGMDLELVQKDLRLRADTSELYEASRDSEMHYLFFMCYQAQSEDAMETLKSYGFSNTSFKGITGTAEETIALYKRELSTLEQKKESLLETLSSYQESNGPMRLAFDRITQEIQKEQCKQRLMATERTFLLEGWVSEPGVPALEQLLCRFDCAYALSTPPEEEYPEVPVKLRGNKLTESLNAVTDMYSLPVYGSLDPNPLMAPFFILFFGMMMADMAYGLLMFFGCMFAIKKMRPRGGTLHLLSLMQYCGVTSFIFGAITGGFFGDMIPQLVEMVSGREIALPHLFSPVDDAVAVLVGSLALGLIQILTGMGINMYKQIKRGQVMAALCGEGAWFVVFILAGVAALTGAVKICLIVIAVVLVLTQGYGKQGVLGKLAGIGGSLYNKITGYFSDILSYSRLMALMLSGAVIAQVFNTLGALTGNVIGFIVIAMVGNALNFALNLLSCYVHDLRLQCLEFFGYFYEDGGKPFEPVSVNPKYVDIVQ